MTVVTGDGNIGAVTLAGVSDDCMTINLCYYYSTYLIDGNWDFGQLDFCYEHSDAILAEELGEKRSLKAGDELLVLQFNQDFFLE